MRTKHFDQGGVREGAIAVPNLWDRPSVGREVKNSQQFLSKIVDTDQGVFVVRSFFYGPRRSQGP